jgi:alkylation response protein AidB-like acyl-CoA dehydrogenase
MTIAREPVAAGSDLPERARSLAPLVDEHAATGDEQGALADEVVQAFEREGLFGMWVPASLGGAELEPIPSLEVIENVSYGDPSAGWVLMATALATGTAGSYLSDEAVAEIFAGGRFPGIAGQGTRPGTAVPHDGGFLLTGSWSFGSGIKHASYTHSLAIIEGTGEPRIFVSPVENANLIENWDVLGLRGTGSIDYTMDGVFVPDGWSHFATLDESPRGGSLYRLGIIGFAIICHSGWALGVGRRMLDELRNLTLAKAGRPGALADSDSFQEQFANAELKYRAARALVYETWEDVQDALARGERPSVHHHTLIRGALTHATWSVQEVGMFVYLAGGTTALRSGTIQRLFRDLHAGTQHVTSSPPVVRKVGQQLAGLAEGKRWLFLDLVD